MLSMASQPPWNTSTNVPVRASGLLCLPKVEHIYYGVGCLGTPATNQAVVWVTRCWISCLKTLYKMTLPQQAENTYSTEIRATSRIPENTPTSPATLASPGRTPREWATYSFWTCAIQLILKTHATDEPAWWLPSWTTMRCFGIPVHYMTVCVDAVTGESWLIVRKR